MYTEKLKLRLKEIEKEILATQNLISEFPEGKLICSKNGKYVKHYCRFNDQLIYIPKSNISYTKLLANKSFYELNLQDLVYEEAAILSYLSKRKTQKNGTALLKSPLYQPLLRDNFFSNDEWASLPYDKNNNYPEHLIHRSISGNILRSKSEVIIDMSLYIHKIPYRYECGLELNQTTIYPDFTIKHPSTGKLLYWEHFGMMDVSSYMREYLWKSQLYLDFGIIPGIQLITTFETKDHPLTADKVEHIIQHYFF